LDLSIKAEIAGQALHEATGYSAGVDACWLAWLDRPEDSKTAPDRTAALLLWLLGVPIAWP
jgi:hypothetical protein